MTHVTGEEGEGEERRRGGRRRGGEGRGGEEETGRRGRVNIRVIWDMRGCHGGQAWLPSGHQDVFDLNVAAMATMLICLSDELL